MTTTPGDMLTTAEAARVLGMTARGLIRRRELGQPPAYYKLGSRVLYKPEDLVAYVEESRVEPVAPVGR